MKPINSQSVASFKASDKEKAMIEDIQKATGIETISELLSKAVEALYQKTITNSSSKNFLVLSPKDSKNDHAAFSLRRLAVHGVNARVLKASNADELAYLNSENCRVFEIKG